MPGGGQSPAKATLVAGSGRKRSRTRQDPWEETHWSHQRWGRAARGLRGVRAGSLARGRVRNPAPWRELGEAGVGGGEVSPLLAKPHSAVPSLPKRGTLVPWTQRLLAWAVGIN